MHLNEPFLPTFDVKWKFLDRLPLVIMFSHHFTLYKLTNNLT